MRSAGVPLQRIRPALARLAHEFGVEHALASRRLYTDGAELLYDYAEHGENADAARAARDLVVLRSGQRVFNEIVESYLQRVEFADDGYVDVVRLPAYEVAEVIVDPTRGFGQPIFARGGARLEDALALFRAGEPLDVVAEEYGVPRAQLEDAVRVATRVPPEPCRSATLKDCPTSSWTAASAGTACPACCAQRACACTRSRRCTAPLRTRRSPTPSGSSWRVSGVGRCS